MGVGKGPGGVLGLQNDRGVPPRTLKLHPCLGHDMVKMTPISRKGPSKPRMKVTATYS